MIIVAGPCQLESSEQAIDIASELHTVCQEYDFDYYFKSSFDKANRTSIHGKRGPGMSKGLEWLNDVKTEVGCKVLTDVHETWQLKEVAPIVDVLQIPAFLCRQTDLLTRSVEIANLLDKKVNIKKGQFLSPLEMINVVEKAKSTGNDQIYVCERGVSFGYNNLVSDMRSLVLLRETKCPVIMDATHAVQEPGGKGKTSGGKRFLVPILARAAVAVGVAGVFIETHQDPDNAPSDGPNMVPLDKLENLLKQLTEIDNLIKN